MKTYQPLSSVLDHHYDTKHNLVVISPTLKGSREPGPVEILHLTGNTDDVLHELGEARSGEATTNVYQFVCDENKFFSNELCDYLNNLDHNDEGTEYNTDKLLEHAGLPYDDRNRFLKELDKFTTAVSLPERLADYAARCRDAMIAYRKGKECLFNPGYDKDEIYNLETFTTPAKMFRWLTGPNHHDFHCGAWVTLVGDEDIARFIKGGGKSVPAEARKEVLQSLGALVNKNRKEFPRAARALPERGHA